MTAAEVLSWQVNLCLIGFPSMALSCVWNSSLPHRLVRVLTWLLINKHQLELAAKQQRRADNEEKKRPRQLGCCAFALPLRPVESRQMPELLCSEKPVSHVIFLPVVFLDFAEPWKRVRSAYPCVPLTFFFGTLPLHQCVWNEALRCTHSITGVSGGPSLDNDVFKPLQRSDGLCPEHHLQSIVLVNQARLSRCGRSSFKHIVRESHERLRR